MLLAYGLHSKVLTLEDFAMCPLDGKETAETALCGESFNLEEDTMLHSHYNENNLKSRPVTIMIR